MYKLCIREILPGAASDADYDGESMVDSLLLVVVVAAAVAVVINIISQEIKQEKSFDEL